MCSRRETQIKKEHVSVRNTALEIFIASVSDFKKAILKTERLPPRSNWPMERAGNQELKQNFNSHFKLTLIICLIYLNL
jgi:hypothetical protein